MKKHLIFSAFLLTLVLFMGLASCTKEGLGGKGEIKGHAYYENKTLKASIFYIKYGADSSPGFDVSMYDASTASDSDGKFHFKGLNEGDYYIYAVSPDEGQTLVGGVHVEIDKDEHKGNVQINLTP
ncbi:SpaA isopeptide-forming pilin-related protein [Pontibacter pamirensis]|uniref:SpaA isopeptide-forming pilin-related protein n=1 Tax=Pontibacter pamirensis TaxID=2562824 RepID=UPI001389AD07|nr:prealbumin-like fold domain-containing protein [Pontibacter pamirensis]